ncbi:Rad4-domain-containing protein [Macroventuria anomochaeta]|uniref:Rad4-domain-containing protein n=1 Tax=Macroventuria anomochaeta TaxID=301207 RepID=A0ACB6RHM1_9PLEO|nr:Rad4-domain-containing protein [Macroventuria anomochaeta]KAF2621391.1 Rad4-domain-containing protein [Macroventuria anomochaeta]
MPPVLSRKRLQSDSPKPEPPPKRVRAPKPSAPKPSARRTKQSVFDEPPKVNRTLSQTKKFLEGSNDDSELSDADSSEDEFEDVPLNNTNTGKGKGKAQEASDSEESEEDDWEDALGVQHYHAKHDAGPDPKISGDIALTLSAVPKAAFDSKPDGKKGPSKIQRQIRNVSHCMHVQCLMFHNLMRNAWIEDKEVQKTLVEGLTSGCWREIEQYWRDAGIPDGASRAIMQKKAQKTPEKIKDTKTEAKCKKGNWKASGSNGVKVYDNPDNKLSKQRKEEARREYEASLARDKITGASERKQRDWGAKSKRMNPETPNMAHGDPLLRLLKYLSAYWKAKWRTTAPTLRKRGYLSPSTLQGEIDAWKEYGSHADSFGERVESREAFRVMARRCEGSKDVGQQLFTALIRGLGIEARMIVSLQPIGFGFSQAEEGKPKNLEKLKDLAKSAPSKPTPAKPKKSTRQQPISSRNRRKVVASSGSDSDSSDLSSVVSISSDAEDDKLAKKASKTRDYNNDLPYPTYWTEVISNLTHTPVTVSPLSRTIIASSTIPEKYSDFYARGATADKAKQVLAYLIAFSSDGTAKDVTTRYLPKHQWPGRTKGFRMPIEKIPIHNKRGKVKRWEEWDWFKSVMRPFSRPHDKRQPWDEVEEEGDLVPAEPEKKKTMDEEGGKETLQGYKTSAEYVLERHLRREEALKPGANIVRHFAISKKGEEDKLEPVYRRKDIVNCKTTESWHKEGREVKPGEHPLKYVPMRAVTKTRKLEIEERERIEGGKVQQGLYAKSQTDWIIPDPIVDGIIPVNAFNNIDVYVSTMVPRGAVHIPLKGTARVCRKLNINYADACTGFEFGKQRAVPVITGVVVAEENEHLVIDAWEAEEAEKLRKEAEKRQKFVLGLWKKFYSGLKIVQRMKDEYGEEAELPQEDLFAPMERKEETEWEVFQKHQGKDFEGGFLHEEPGIGGGGFVRKEAPAATHDEDMAGGFFPASQEEIRHGDLTIDLGDHEDQKRTPVADTAYRTPISLSAAVEQPVDEEDDDGADQQEGDAQDTDAIDSEDKDDKPLVPPRPKSSKLTPTRSERTSTSTLTRKRKSIIESSDEESLSDAPSDPPTPPPSTRSAPKRKAARKSDAQVKSHFFAMGSEDETDATDITDRASPKKSAGTGRGRGRSGRERGGGRGKAT